MKTALTRLLQSMKFWTLVLGVVVTWFGAYLARHGFDMSDKHVEKVAEYLALFFSMLLAGQGLTDIGKGKVEAEKVKAPDAP